MTFEEALSEFKVAIAKQYGLHDGLIKIGVLPELLDRVLTDMFNSPYGRARFFPGNMGEVFIAGVQIVPRMKEKF